MFKKILSVSGVSVILALLISSVVLAAPSTVTNFTANPSDTTIILSWTKAVGSNSTVIQERTDQFPTSPTDGTNVYNSTKSQVQITGLTAGTVYYFAAYGYDSTNYGTVVDLAVATLATALPNGAANSNSVVVPSQSVTNLNSAPDTSGFNFEPFTSIIANFATSANGLGLPDSGHAWEWLTICVIVALGIVIYISVKNFFVAYGAVIIMSAIAVGLHLAQGYMVGIELVIGFGIWAIENYFQ